MNPSGQPIPSTMLAARLYVPGPATNFVLEQLPVPNPGPGQVLIRVRAFGLNRSELMTRKGLSPSVQFPRVLGIECAGEVVHDPSGELVSGQQVLAWMGEMGRAYDGSYATYAVLPRNIITPFNSQLPWEILGAVPEMFQTAHGSLFPALGIQEGETLLIRGGTSSVGLLAIQLARKAGLTVWATTRNRDKEVLLVERGASKVLIDDGQLSRQVRELCPQGVEKVLELVGANTLRDSLRCVAPGGTVCMTGMLSESWTLSDFSPMEAIPATVRLTTFDSGAIRSSDAAMHSFLHDLETGGVHLAIGHVFSLNQLPAAHQLMEENRANGKIVVTT